MRWTPEELVRFSGSYWGVCALHAAVALDLFSCLGDGPLKDEDLAARLGCSRRGVVPLTAALCAMGLLSREEDGSVALTPFSRDRLRKDADGYLGHIVNHHRQLMPGWASLEACVREGRPARERVAFGDEEERGAFIMGMDNMASVRAAQAVRAVDLSGRRRLLDLGGGPGAYSVRFCEANADLRATIFDLPTTRPYAEGVVRRRGMTDRIVFESGDFFADPLPQGFDVVWISHILHGSGDEEARRLLAKAMDSLNPGGLLLIQEFILDDRRDGPLFAALFGLNMLTGTPTGKAFAESELKALLAGAGARDVRRLPMASHDGSGIVAGEKP